MAQRLATPHEVNHLVSRSVCSERDTGDSHNPICIEAAGPLDVRPQRVKRLENARFSTSFAARSSIGPGVTGLDLTRDYSGKILSANGGARARARAPSVRQTHV